MINKDQVSMDKVANWLGWDRINLELASDQIRKLTEENQKLNEMLAQAKLGKKDAENKG
jgi:hypothetical protein